jgi:SAM-dependent methyltransferase
MATPGDFEYIRMLIRKGVIAGSVLELGSYARQGEKGNTEEVIRGVGLEWTGSDIEAGPGVDFTLDLLDVDQVKRVKGRWESVLVMNLLEHVYDPASVLRNACTLVAPGGVCVAVGPAVWQLHDFPKDYWRPLPDFYEEFAVREVYEYLHVFARWIVGGTLVPIAHNDVGQKIFPSGSQLFGEGRWRFSRAVNQLFNTAARQMAFTYVGLGIVLRVKT